MNPHELEISAEGTFWGEGEEVVSLTIGTPSMGFDCCLTLAAAQKLRDDLDTAIAWHNSGIAEDDKRNLRRIEEMP